jgi:hypothetical protein
VEEEGVIRVKLDLLIRVLDTTTGSPVEEKNIIFTLNGKMVRATSRGYGNFIFMNCGRENGLMQIEVYGYEPYTVNIDYEKLDPIMPAIDAFLIPSENLRKGESLLTLKGNLPGISSIEAINPDRPICSIREFDAKRRIMTVFMPNRRMNMIHTYYGLANVRDGTFEEFQVEKELPENRLRIKEPLAQEFSLNSPICRILYGMTDEKGNYLFRVRNSGKEVVYLLKYVVDDTTKYLMLDFHNLEGVKLT